jgi:transcriptional regulator with XRE-family HTH domain
VIDACANARQALSVCVRLSGFTDECVAERVGLSKGHLSKILSGRASLDSDRRIRLMLVCGNLAPMQYEVKAMGAQLLDDDTRRRLAMLTAAVGGSAGTGRRRVA